MPRATKIVATLAPHPTPRNSGSHDPRRRERGAPQLLARQRPGITLTGPTWCGPPPSARGTEVAIMADLQGPKIRVGKFANGKVMLENGLPFVLDASRTELGDEAGVGLDYKELPRDVKPGDVLLLNDGLIVLKVDSVKGAAVFTTVVMGGELSNNKGINKQGGGLTAPALTVKDTEDIPHRDGPEGRLRGRQLPKNATDMELARHPVNMSSTDGHRPGLIAKIERAEAIPELENILKASDGIMGGAGDRP